MRKRQLWLDARRSRFDAHAHPSSRAPSMSTYRRHEGASAPGWNTQPRVFVDKGVSVALVHAADASARKATHNCLNVSPWNRMRSMKKGRRGPEAAGNTDRVSRPPPRAGRFPRHVSYDKAGGHRVHQDAVPGLPPEVMWGVQAHWRPDRRGAEAHLVICRGPTTRSRCAVRSAA